MKKLAGKMQTFLIRYLKMPSDVILELPRITMVSHLHVYIENHQGLVHYSDTELQLKIHKGYLRIKGHAFVLKTMLPSEILLEGNIKEVTFLQE
ncbi:MAG TPA: sporulation protein YqfC [Candidatus Avamphibacillus intestinigallinarum]|nr:sporulation protein YqfC [Candidatus Avamphibacillus intestinigallinarum]